MPRKPSTECCLAKLERLAKGQKRALILLQNNPDPDAIASAAALKLLLRELGGCETVIAHGGVVGRAENRSMLRYLGVTLRPADSAPLEKFDLVAMVDTQPGFGNNPVNEPERVDVVIDHHERAGRLPGVALCDVRPNYGATSSILAEYLLAARIKLPTPLATALAYGIQSDTQDLGRETSDADIAAFTQLYPLANKRLLSRIENEQEPREYFDVVSRALLDARTYRDVGVCWLGRIPHPELTGEIADFLVRCDEIDWALCQGLHDGTLYVSLRTDIRNENADNVMRKIIAGIGTGGGHEMIAGGQVLIERNRLTTANRIRKQIERNLLAHFKLDPKCRRALVCRARKSPSRKTAKA